MTESTSSPQEDTQRVHIYDHPASRIAFLETALSGQHWRATIYPSALSTRQSLDDIARTLRARGFHTEIGKDSHHNTVLSIDHLPAEAGLIETIQSLGLASGVQHSLKGMSAEKLFHHVKQGAQYVISDKAHLISAFYLLGDAFLTLSGADNPELSKEASRGFVEKLKSLRKPENALQSLSGISSAMNSLILMVYAQEGNSKDYKQLKEQFYKAMIHGKDPTDISQWEPPERAGGMLGKLHQALGDHPIVGSATSQIVSQILLIASGGIRKHGLNTELGHTHTSEIQEEIKKKIRGSNLDIGRGVASTLGWVGMLYPSHKVEQKAPWHDPKRVVHEFQEHPERFTSFLTGGASVLGMAGSRDKRNFSQFAGEAALLLGDVTIFFTDMSEYGHKKASPDSTGAMAARFISEAPAIMSQEQQDAFVDRLSNYLAGHLAVRNPELNPIQEAPKLAEAIRQQLATSPSRLDDLTNELTATIRSLPQNQRLSATHAFSEAIAAMPGVYVGRDALQQMVTQRLEAGPAQPGTPQTMHQMAPRLAAMIDHLPCLAIPQNAIRLYDVMSQFAQGSSRDSMHLGHALKQQIRHHTGLSMPQLNQAEQQARQTHGRAH